MTRRTRRNRSAGFEGRPLPRPDDEIYDQGLMFDLGTALSRRRVLAVVGAGAGAATVGLFARGSGAFAAVASASGSTEPSAPATEIPEETAGPYPGDGSNGPDILEQTGIVRSDITTSIGDATGVAEGVPTTVELTIYDLANGGVPFAGAALYLWHCSREGGYSMYSPGVENENFLRGVQIADADGKLAFQTIFPACYSGRWPHMHFEVYPDEASITDSTSAIATSQLALPQDVCDVVYAEAGYEQSVTNLAQLSLATDGVFSDDGAATQLATVSGDVASGYTVSLSIGVDTTTAAGGGTMGGGPDGGGPGGPPTTSS
jgi:protocatechuate 3,4-dioxygenase beta subunit